MKSIEQMALEAYPTESFGSACVTEEDMYRQAYIKGAKAVLALFEEEIDHHRCPEHGYFCDCLDDINIALKGDEL